MNIIQVFQSFENNDQAAAYLERVRWNGRAVCPYCKGRKTCRHRDDTRNIRRWQCWVCQKSFAVTVGTVFHRTHIPLQKWFLILALMLNAKKSVSSCQIARDLGMRQSTAWSIMQRIRAAMACDPKQRALFHGIVEMDETYIGGKPRKRNRVEDRVPFPRGKGTSKKTPVVGALERGGRVYAQLANGSTDLASAGLGRFIRRFVEQDGTILMTDRLAVTCSMP